MTQWADASSEQHWKGIDRLLDLLEVAAPPGDAAAEPTFWRLRLATWRLLGQRQDFEAAGRDMQTLYGESPAPWQPPRQTVREGEPARETGRSEFMVSTQPDHLGRVRSAQIDLSGQLTGDIAGALARCDNELREAEVITVDCARLVRVDFVAAGELINWVAERRERQKAVHFRELHRLVALFFCAMGLDDHATLEVRSA
jgi:ABC-type transporter Mla MlaB component